jgi:hypothetical protein
MSKVRIVQLLCPQRHCIVATAYQSPDGEVVPEITDVPQGKFAHMVELGVNPWCGICSSRDLQPEDRPTPYATLAEAAPFLRHLADAQAATRAFFRASKG